MSILVIGATGAVGSLLVERLAAAGASVKALVRTPGKRSFPAKVDEVVADLGDVAGLRRAYQGVRTLFLLNAVTPDEVTQAMLALNLAREAGIERVVYLSVIHADLYANVPHFAGKFAVERMIEDLAIPTTILRPAYFMQNDVQIKDVVLAHGVYPMPIGQAGVAMIDTRDIADIAALELLRRDGAAAPLPTVRYDLVGPEALSAAQAAGVWSELLDRPVQVGEGEPAAFERQMAGYAPGWMAYDMRLMMERIQRHGMHGAAGARERLETLLGRPLRTYRAAVHELLAAA